MVQRDTHTLRNCTNITARSLRCFRSWPLKQVVVTFSYNTWPVFPFPTIRKHNTLRFYPHPHWYNYNSAPDDLNWELFALPASSPASTCDPEYISSRSISEPLVDAILQQSEYSYSCLTDQVAAKKAIRDQKNLQIEHVVESLKSALPPARKRAMELASEKGASSWLTTLPIEEFCFCLYTQRCFCRRPGTALRLDSLSHSRLMCL